MEANMAFYIQPSVVQSTKDVFYEPSSGSGVIAQYISQENGEHNVIVQSRLGVEAGAPVEAGALLAIVRHP